MRWLVLLAVLFQLYQVTRIPQGRGMEPILVGQAMDRGVVPYSQFKFHDGPVMPLFFAGLFAVPSLIWIALVYCLFNLLTTRAIYLLSRLHGCSVECACAAAILFLLLLPWWEANGSIETAMTTFGLWAFYFAGTDRKELAAVLVVLAALTKQTGLIFGLCLL
jgi:hypothetical protein